MVAHAEHTSSQGDVNVLKKREKENENERKCGKSTRTRECRRENVFMGVDTGMYEGMRWVFSFIVDEKERESV